MTRLQTEIRRLFDPAADGDGYARCAVLELLAPVDTDALAALWSGVQNDFSLPPPAIAASGGDALQLWFALREPVTHAALRAFVDGLRTRYLAAVPAHRQRGWPDAGSPPPAVPGAAVGPERWSAFVSPDLAPLFAETPWLELPPGDDAQASLLAALQPIGPEAFAAALARLQPAAVPAVDPAAAPAAAQAERFLLAVMHDTTAPLAQRIKAARALLQRPGA
ncbi:hypothetical protein [Rubrivivax gelatinosus]|uniref:Uncharacterized protein n=1 Tax=Rubrivivax gelatinosus TaxID=28068 RepID=A0ABS1DX74_RUBGE|nr:hypothetical protein [Rubrivivax gelatinosus]MBK1714235.1 hypothetical protein [Rubrivivax gelatinosus]